MLRFSALRPRDTPIFAVNPRGMDQAGLLVAGAVREGPPGVSGSAAPFFLGGLIVGGLAGHHEPEHAADMDPSPSNTPPTSLARLMTPGELAHYLSVSKRTVRRMTAERMVPVVMVRSLPRYEPAKVVGALLDAALEARTR